MNRFTKLATGLTLALASSAALAQGGIQIDPLGTGSIGGSTFAPGEIANQTSSIIFKGCFPTNSIVANSCAAYAQGYSSGNVAGAGRLVWQMILPVDVIDPTGTGISMRVTNAVAPIVPAQFSLFFDTSGTFGDTQAQMTQGIGFGDLGGDAPRAGLVEIATGTPSIRRPPGDPAGSFGVADFVGGGVAGGSLDTGPNSNPTGPLPAPIGADITDFSSVATINANGSMTINIDVLTQDDDYIVNDLVNADLLLNIDALINNAGIQAPYTDGNNITASQRVTGQRADFDGDGFGVADRQAGEANDFLCAGGPVCDAQFQLNPSLTFNAERVAEPGSLAMIGLGLATFGLVAGGVRRRRQGA